MCLTSRWNLPLFSSRHTYLFSSSSSSSFSFFCFCFFFCFFFQQEQAAEAQPRRHVTHRKSAQERVFPATSPAARPSWKQPNLHTATYRYMVQLAFIHRAPMSQRRKRQTITEAHMLNLSHLKRTPSIYIHSIPSLGMPPPPGAGKGRRGCEIRLRRLGIAAERRAALFPPSPSSVTRTMEAPNALGYKCLHITKILHSAKQYADRHRRTASM
ncbi:hypothetical protein L249_6111 [Ophiocordyceps polyrhachis-furcata BCC 54312]|uniref:Uncharacterized protein n=1 Tax=Ophiocordyceps polyrhachis-furcata BCC 54312 TaxID=1330021 RepID=A0A367LIR0_9HYPO|nr:hypothetical protein L249_6111 [Ophiocordyceps polyrhachis-furcata BCC 54312]